MPIQFEIDEKGNLITRPVGGWKAMSIGGVAVLLAIQFAESPSELERGGKLIQFALTPHQCLELAGVLTTEGKVLLEPKSRAGKPPN